MTVARARTVRPGFHGPGFPSLLAGTGLRWSGDLRDGLDAPPGGGDRLPRTRWRRFQGSAASAAHEASAPEPRRHLLLQSEREGGPTPSCYYSKSLIQYKS